MYQVVFKMKDIFTGWSREVSTLEEAKNIAKKISLDTNYYVYIYNGDNVEYFCKNGEIEKNNS